MCGQDHDRCEELPAQDVEVVARRLAGLGARHLVLTGGEPFLRPDLPEIIAIFRRHGFSIRVQTNGGPQVREEFSPAASKPAFGTSASPSIPWTPPCRTTSARPATSAATP